MRVKDIMTGDFQVATSRSTLQEVAEIMRNGGFGYLPVREGDKLKGAVTDRDIVVRGLADGFGPETPILHVMSESIVYCLEDDDIREAADLMQREQIRRLAVLNDDKRLVGVVSLGDIARVTDDRALTGAIEVQVAQPL
ncbi:MAG TPA: CBS domain-containing protein [Asticcacaulis sp.]|jgi:CBS domain-containing protein|nr:CBS domain-containing protein [Asticcacaulis sp.]